MRIRFRWWTMEAGDPKRLRGGSETAAPDDWFAAGNAAFRQGDVARAATSYQRAVELSPTHADAWVNLGAAYRRLERIEDAAACARTALQLRPDDTRALNNLANALDAQGQFEEAARCYRRAIELRPDDAAAYYNLVNQQPLNDGSPQSEAVFEQLLRQSKRLDRFSLAEQSALLFALGKALDARGDVDAAFESFSRANALHRSTLRFDIEAAERQAAAIAQQFDAPSLARLARAGSASERPIFVVGMPRSGTTLIEQIISAHPDVHGAGEIGVLPTLVSRIRTSGGRGFPYWAAGLSAADLQRLSQDYLRALEPLGGAKPRVTDKTIGNFELLGLIHLLFPNASIIHCRRDIRDVCVSCFTTRFSGGHPYAYDLEELGRYSRLYDRLMAHWGAVLPPERMFAIDYEALVQDLDGWARRLIAHLGLEWTDACLRFYDSQREVRTASFVQVRRPIHQHSVGRWRRFERHLGPLLKTLEGA